MGHVTKDEMFLYECFLYTVSHFVLITLHVVAYFTRNMPILCIWHLPQDQLFVWFDGMIMVRKVSITMKVQAASRPA